MKKSRFIFYLLISFLLGLVDFLKDVREDESILAALEFVPIVIPIAFVFLLIIYYVRLWVLNTPIFERFLYKEDGNSHKWSFYAISIILQTFFYTSIVAFMGKLFYPNYTSFGLTSLFFWVNFTIIFSVIVFVYIIEAFLDSEEEKQKFSIKLREIENERIISRYQALKNQLNPHFLFNSFNSLSALISVDINKAEDFLQELSNVYRYNLDHSEDLVVSLEKELKLIKSYMSLQSIRFPESFSITYNIDESRMDYLIPPMTLELMLENALKHNIIEKANPLKITVSTEEDYIVVENNLNPRGTAVDKNLSFGIGLKNLKNQYELIHTELPTFNIKDNKYVARIPLITPNI